LGDLGAGGAAKEEALLWVLDGLGSLLLEGTLRAGVSWFSGEILVQSLSLKLHIHQSKQYSHLTKHCDLVIWVSLVSFLVQLSQPRQKNSQKFSRLKSTIRSSRADSTFVPCQKPQDQKCQPQVAYSQLSQARLNPDTRTPVIVGLAASKFGVLCPEVPT
jgi:hypothetical protein